MRTEAEARQFQFLSEFVGIVQFSVIDDSVFFAVEQGAHRLLTVQRVDDAEPSVQKRRVTLYIFAVLIRSATPETFRHRPEFCILFFHVDGFIQPACYSAHSLPPYLKCHCEGHCPRQFIISVTDYFVGEGLAPPESLS